MTWKFIVKGWGGMGWGGMGWGGVSRTILALQVSPQVRKLCRLILTAGLNTAGRTRGAEGVPCLIYKCFLYGNKLIRFGVDSP